MGFLSPPHHGGWAAQHAQSYLDEWVFRFNRRNSKARGLLFYRLLQNAVVMPKITYTNLLLSRRADAGKERGRPPHSHLEPVVDHRHSGAARVEKRGSRSRGSYERSGQSHAAEPDGDFALARLKACDEETEAEALVAAECPADRCDSRRC